MDGPESGIREQPDQMRHSMRQVKRIFGLIFFLLITGAGGPVVPAAFGDVATNHQTPHLSEAAYAKTEKELITLLYKKNPRTALIRLSKLMKKDRNVAAECHRFVHALGREALKKYEDFSAAIAFRDPLCISGYTHGVIEASFENSSDIIESIRTACEKYEERSFGQWNCYHGVGHGTMYYTGNNLIQSLGLCNEYPSEFEQVTCADGAFMENFNSDTLVHPTAYLRPGEPAYPCFEIDEKFRSACVLYAAKYTLSLEKNNYKKALGWCATLDKGVQEPCFAGIGGEAVKHFITEPTRAVAVCKNAPSAGREPCLDGLIGLFIDHHGSLKEARALCPSLKKGDRPVCTAAIEKRAYLFP